MNVYVFTLEYSLKGPVTDWLVDASALVGQTPESYELACMAADLLEPGSSADMHAVLDGLQRIQLRARYTALGRAFVYRSPTAMTRDDLDAEVKRMAQLDSLDQLEKF